MNLLSLLTFLPLALSGCYTYAETSLTEVTPGLQARLTLTEDGFGRVVNQAASNGVSVDMLDMSRRGVVGLIRELGPSSMTVVLRGGGGSVFAADVPVAAVQDVAIRTFSRTRTIGAAAALAVVFAAVYTGVAGGTVSPGQPPEPEQLVLPGTLSIGGVSSTLGRFDVFSARLRIGR